MPHSDDHSDVAVRVDRMERAVARAIRDAGGEPLHLGRIPTPALAHCALGRSLPCIMITGSHNPPEYNGFKMVLGGSAFFGDRIRDVGVMASAGDWEEGSGSVADEDVIDLYVDRLMRDFDGDAYRVGWDAGNGAAGPAVEKLTAKLPGEHHLLYTEVDSRFPNHHPDPTDEKNLADLQRLVKEKGLDFGFAFDGDGDRIGAVDSTGRVVWGDQIMMVLAEALLADCPGATIIADVKASRTLFDRIAELGGEPLMWKTGHSLIKAKMKETGAPLAGEMSGHIFLAHRPTPSP